MDIEQSTTVVPDGLALLLEQYQNHPRIEGLLTAYLNRVQELEDVVWQVIVQRLIDNATGVLLDAIGKIVGQPRGSFDDATFRLWIQARILINRTNGHADDVINVLALLDAATFSFIEYYPASFDIEYESPPGADLNQLAAIVAKARGGGIGSAIVASSFPQANALVLSYGENIASSTQGLADTALTVGGYMANVYG